MISPTRLALAVLALCLSVPPLARAQFSFTDRTSLLSNAGFGASRCSSGVAMGVVDMDGDGKDDIIRLHDAQELAIEIQTTPGGAFGHRFVGTAAISPWALCVADVDKNGFNDLILAPFAGGIRLYEADATGANYAISQLPLSDMDCQGTLFADLNRDGHIDLFSCHDTADNVKWENYGGGELVRNAALLPTELPAGNAGNYAALWTDFDRDGRSDLYLSKCSQGNDDPGSPERINRLFENSTSGFRDVAPGLGLADGAQSWCADFADIDNDGDLDAFLLNHPEPGSPQPSKLFENVGGSYQDITASGGLGAPLTGVYGIQALFRDFDNDGFADLLVSSSDAGAATPTYLIFRNNGDKSFTRQANAFVVGGTTGGAGTPLDYMQSFAVGDLNHDGFLDIYSGRGSGFNSPTNAADVMFMNDGNAANHFLALQLTGTVSNINAIGARVEIFGPWGSQTREVRAGEGYGIMNSLTVHFGLGAATTADRVLITWPSGFTTELSDVAADQFLAITESVDPGDFVAPVLTSPADTTALANSRFTYRTHADNHPQGFALANGPTGMAVSPTGTVTWIPDAPGQVTFDVTATNPAGSDTQTVTVTVEPNLLPPAIEAEAFLVTTGATDPWRIQSGITHDNIDAAQGAAVEHGESTFMELELDGPGEASFWWRVSSEADFDFLALGLDGSEIDSLSGNSGWIQKTLDIPDGTHTIRWTYQKDGSVSEGNDTGWVDEFSFVTEDSDGDGLSDSWELANFGNLDQTGNDNPDGDNQNNAEEEASGTDPLDPLSNLRITAIEPLGDGRFQLTWDGVSGVAYSVQSSTDLTSWSDVSAVLPGGGAEQSFTIGAPTEFVTLLDEIAPCHALVPEDDALGTLWRGGDEAGFANAGGLAGWTAGSTGVGYDSDGPNAYGPFLNLDVQAQMFGRRPGVYIRIPFTVDNPADLVALRLGMRYDDGFVAFINGARAAADNDPATLDAGSTASSNHPDSSAMVLQPFDITASIGELAPGENLLAIHGLNRTTTSGDMLIQPQLIGERRVPGAEKTYCRVVVVQ